MIGGFALSGDRLVAFDSLLGRFLRDTVGAVPFTTRNFVYLRLDAVCVVSARAQLARNQSGACRGDFATAHDTVTLARRFIHAFVAVPEIRVENRNRE